MPTQTLPSPDLQPRKLRHRERRGKKKEPVGVAGSPCMQQPSCHAESQLRTQAVLMSPIVRVQLCSIWHAARKQPHISEVNFLFSTQRFNSSQPQDPDYGQPRCKYFKSPRQTRKGFPCAPLTKMLWPTSGKVMVPEFQWLSMVTY